MTAPTTAEQRVAMFQAFDGLAIVATQIGYRSDSSEKDRAFGDALFRLSERWQILRQVEWAEL